MNYSGFVSDLAALLVTDTDDADFVAILPRCIETAELRCYRDLQPVALLTTTLLTTTPDLSTLTMPADFIAPRSLMLSAGGVRTELQKRDDRYLAEYWPNASLTGSPVYWADLTADVLQLAPTPGSAMTISLRYIHRPAPLSASNTETWLSRRCPDLMIAAAMIFMGGFQKNYGKGDDPKEKGFWEAEYDRALKLAILEEAQRRGRADTPAT